MEGRRESTAAIRVRDGGTYSRQQAKWADNNDPPGPGNSCRWSQLILQNSLILGQSQGFWLSSGEEYPLMGVDSCTKGLVGSSGRLGGESKNQAFGKLEQLQQRGGHCWPGEGELETCSTFQCGGGHSPSEGLAETHAHHSFGTTQAPNVSAVTEFQLLGFRSLQEWQTLLFTIFLLIYLLTLTGNIVIITVVSQDRRLHSPMYTFLQHLSFLEIWYVSTIVPLLLANLASWGRAISFSACMAQLYFFVFFGATECFLLAMMAYDQYLAICSPLRYPFLMSPDTCRHLVALCWLTGVGTGFLPSMMISQLDFCGPNQINHFFCDLPPLMQLSCSSAHVTEMAIFVLSVAVLCVCFLLTLVSYVFIVSSILRIPSASGRKKTFSTCGSHLAVVTIYYGTMISMYVHPSAHLSPEINKIISVFYTVVTPLMNPVIYSLRNKDFKEAVRKAIRRQRGRYGVGVRGQVFIR
ncbi:olfactory receptor 11L1-like [Ictidomys tridecemlineatus]